MMKIVPVMPKLPFAMTALCLMLSACGGGSNNISTDDNNGVTQSLCSATDANCVNLVFDDTPVANLYFECGVYFGKTGNTGVARCPINSTAKFSIRSAKGRKINLGEYVVKPVRTISATELLDTSLIRVGPKDLVESITKTPISSLDDESAKTAINLSRLIQSIGLQSEPYIASAPVNRIFIEDTLVNGRKAQAATATTPALSALPGLDILTEDIEATAFKDGTFEAKLKPWLDAYKRSLISEAEAKTRLQKTILAVKSGFFYGTPAQRLNVGNTGTELDLDLGISGTGTINPATQNTNAVFALTNRQGDSIGYGMQWVATGEAVNTPQKILKMYVENNFAKMRLLHGGVDPFTSRFKNFQYQVSTAKYVGEQSDSYGGTKKYEDTFAAGNVFSFINGKLQRDLVVPGTVTAYRKYLDTNQTPDASDLGSWEQRELGTGGTSGSLGSRNYSGAATLSKVGAINTYLDPKVWRVQELVPKGQNYIFPLYAILEFQYTKAYLDVCKDQLGEANCPTSRKLPVAFLENGDIWTDFSLQDTDKDTACLPPVMQDDTDPSKLDIRIGTVRASFLNTTATQYYISPSILLSGEKFKELDGIQVGTGAGSERVKINVTGVRNAAAGTKGSLNVTSAEAIVDGSGNIITDGLQNENDATWLNSYNALISSFVAAAEAETGDDKKVVPPALKLASKQSIGVLKIAPAACYKVLQKS